MVQANPVTSFEIVLHIPKAFVRTIKKVEGQDYPHQPSSVHADKNTF